MEEIIKVLLERIEKLEKRVEELEQYVEYETELAMEQRERE